MAKGIDWKKYRQYRGEMHAVEIESILQAFKSWTQGNDCADSWGTTDSRIAFEMFSEGWIAGQVAAGQVQQRLDT